MKAFIALVAIIVAVQALTDEQKQKLLAHHRECAAATGVDQDLVTRARKGDFVDDKKFKDHLFCVSKKIGFQNEAGELQEEVLRAKVNSVLKDLDVTNKLIAKCAVKKDSPGQTAFDSVKCYYENTPQHIALV